MWLEIESSPNCDGMEGMVYQTLAPPRPVRQLPVVRGGREMRCWVTGVEPPGRWIPAQAVKITDSGAGVAYLMYGGRWGLRFQPVTGGPPCWDLRDPTQWGEPSKIYGDLSGVVFGEDP